MGATTDTMSLLFFTCIVLCLSQCVYPLAIDEEIEREVREAEDKLLIDIADALLEENFLERYVKSSTLFCLNTSLITVLTESKLRPLKVVLGGYPTGFR